MVEDEFLVALLLEEALTEAGFRVLGPVASLGEAVELAGSDRLDAALLDIELCHGNEVYPAADILAEHNVPFAFISSQPHELIEDRFIARPMLQKPFKEGEVQALAAKLVR
ncbi:response regulator [Inquilinus limosus]|uniref:response regulator n=1 Tax=Inquilinus limosus TaxID=171674 RepID=UPI003F164EDE